MGHFAVYPLTQNQPQTRKLLDNQATAPYMLRL